MSEPRKPGVLQSPASPRSPKTPRTPLEIAIPVENQIGNTGSRPETFK
jgi:hypothetical protein